MAHGAASWATRTTVFAASAALLGSAIAGWCGPMAGDDAALLQIPTVAATILLAAAALRGWFSIPAFLSASTFLALHSVASYYGYCNVPYDDWLEAAFGVRPATWLHSPRNHFDRPIHLCYGLLLYAPVHELAARLLRIGRRGAAWVAIDFILATSLLYEVAEWLIAVFMAPSIAERYNGQQGDPWDAQKDMALAACGAIIAAAWCYFVRRTDSEKVAVRRTVS
jgi:putative membrane protein